MQAREPGAYNAAYQAPKKGSVFHVRVSARLARRVRAAAKRQQLSANAWLRELMAAGVDLDGI